MIHPKVLSIYLTFNCNLKCAHCYVRSKLREQPELQHLKQKTLTLEEIERVTKVVAEPGHLKAARIMGGEPTLYATLLVDTLKMLQEYGIQAVHLLTNGWMGRDSTKARHYLQELKNAGLSHLTISTDAFHLPHLPFEHALNFAQVALEVGIGMVVIYGCILEDIEAQNPFDQETRRLMDLAAAAQIPVTLAKVRLPRNRRSQLIAESSRSSPPTAMRDNAQYYNYYINEPDMNTYLNQVFSKYPLCLQRFQQMTTVPYSNYLLPFPTPVSQAEIQETGKQGCRPYFINSFRDPHQIDFDPCGNLTLCSAFRIANIHEPNWQEHLRNYNVQQNPLIACVYSQGPQGLAEIARQHGAQFDLSAYQHKCELCGEVREFLLPHFPQHLSGITC